jgi:hypothetical protein
MKFLKFRLVDRTNPTTGEIVRKLVVLADDSVEYSYLTDLSVDEVKNRRDELIATCHLIDTKFGKCAVSNRSTIIEEF